MKTLQQVIAEIRPLDQEAMAKAEDYLSGLLKPVGSLGRLETLAIQLAGITRGQPLAFPRKQIMVMAADHGVYDEGVAISPQVVTAIQALNMLKQNTGVCVLAKNAGAEVTIVDVGINSEPLPDILNLSMGRGSANIAKQAAMTREKAIMLLENTASLTQDAIADGVTLLGVGELGIANTTVAAAIVSVLANAKPEEVVGIGANLPLDRLQHKVNIVEQAIRINQPNAEDGIDVLAKVGGFDIGGMAGVMLGAAASGVPVLLDGFLSYAAALIACRIAPEAKGYLIPSHMSAEKGAEIALCELGLTPYLHLDMRLGEGSGAAMAIPIIDAACAIYNEMGTLAGCNIELPSH